jgi:carbamoyl-phosphate synthase small subunit
VGIAGIDTRRLTRILRRSGAQNACLWALPIGEGVCEAHWDEALAAAQSASSMAGLDLAKVVSRRDEMQWNEGEWSLGQGFAQPDERQLHVVAYDFGVKRNILRMLASAAAASPWCRPDAGPSVLELQPDGVFLSNGPGDPEPCDYAIAATQEFLRHAACRPSASAWATRSWRWPAAPSTFKMKFGHHGGNHPVKDLDSGRVAITSQNHGFAVDETTLPANVRATHVSLFDGTCKAWPAPTAGLQLPGAPGGQPRAARHWLPVRPLHDASMMEKKNA